MTNPKEITEQDINRRVAEALGYQVRMAHNGNVTTIFADNLLYGSYEAFEPLKDAQLFCRLLMDNWEGITNVLGEWFAILAVRPWESTPSGKTAVGYTPWDKNQIYLANKELWILRALVAYKEGQK